MISWVLPGVEEVRTRLRRLMRRLMREDLPTLERPAKATSGRSPAGYWLGLTAEVTLLLGGEQEQAAYLIPVAALIPGSGDSEAAGAVFVFDNATSTVVRTHIRHGGIRDNNIVVDQGLEAGDIIAVAGVSFLRDGQEVRLMEP